MTDILSSSGVKSSSIWLCKSLSKGDIFFLLSATCELLGCVVDGDVESLVASGDDSSLLLVAADAVDAGG